MTPWPDSSLFLVFLDCFVESMASSFFFSFLFFLPGHFSLLGEPMLSHLLHASLLPLPMLALLLPPLLLPKSMADCSIHTSCLGSLFQFHHDDHPFSCSHPLLFANFLSPFCYHLPLPMHSLWSPSIWPPLFMPFLMSFLPVLYTGLPSS